MSAKSAPNSTPTVSSSGYIVSFWSTTWSCMPSPTKRSRRMEIESSGRLSVSGLRRKNAAEKYSTVPEESSSGRFPSMVRHSRERKRVSSANSPCVVSRTSPSSSEMQNVAPSRIVSCGTRLADDSSARGLVPGLHDDLVHVHVPRAGEREEDAVGDVLRRERVDALVHGVRLLLVALEADDGELGLREPRVDGGDPDRPAEQILAQRVREAAHRELRGDVRRRALVRLPPGDRAHVDDVPVLGDVRQYQPRHAHEPVHVGLEDGALVLLGRVVERSATEREAGVVHEDVDSAAELLDRRRDKARAAVHVGDVERQRDLRLQPLGAACAAHDADAELRQPARGGAAEAGRGAGDDRRPAGEIEIRHRA